MCVVSTGLRSCIWVNIGPHVPTPDLVVRTLEYGNCNFHWACLFSPFVICIFHQLNLYSLTLCLHSVSIALSLYLFQTHYFICKCFAPVESNIYGSNREMESTDWILIFISACFCHFGFLAVMLKYVKLFFVFLSNKKSLFVSGWVLERAMERGVLQELFSPVNRNTFRSVKLFALTW